MEKARRAADVAVVELCLAIDRRRLRQSIQDFPNPYRADLLRIVRSIEDQYNACSRFAPSCHAFSDVTKLKEMIAQVFVSIEEFDKWFLLAQLSV